MPLNVAQQALTWENELIEDIKTALGGKKYDSKLKALIYASWIVGLQARITFNEHLVGYDKEKFLQVLEAEKDVLNSLKAEEKLKAEEEGAKAWVNDFDEHIKILDELIKEAENA